jgi:hypothetical protein
MRNSFAQRGGFLLVKAPSHRQQVARRRLAVVGGVTALAVVSGLIGSLSHSNDVRAGAPHTGPFSYFPSE